MELKIRKKERETEGNKQIEVAEKKEGGGQQGEKMDRPSAPLLVVQKKR